MPILTENMKRDVWAALYARRLGEYADSDLRKDERAREALVYASTEVDRLERLLREAVQEVHHGT